MIYRFFYKLYIYICTCTIYDIIWIFILVYLVLNAEMKYENAIEINFNREIFVSLTIYIYNKFIALMKAQTWWKGSKTFRVRNERSWFYYFVIFLYKKKKQFHHNFASQPLFNSSSSFRLKIIFNVEKIHSKLYISSISNALLCQTISCHNHPLNSSHFPSKLRSTNF